MEYMMDLHSHTYFSDGTESPEDVVIAAAQEGLELLAITDHDCVDGVKRAVAEGERRGVKVIPAIEMDVALNGDEMHLIALDVKPDDPGLAAALKGQEEERIARNARTLQMLASAGMRVKVERDPRGRLLSRTHIAQALVKEGYASTIDQAFSYMSKPGDFAYCGMRRLEASEYFKITGEMGAKVVMAHPCQLKRDPADTAETLKAMGLWGIELYYPAHTLRQVASYREIALRLGLHCTAGSDFHGKARPQSTLGLVSRTASFDPMAREAFMALW